MRGFFFPFLELYLSIEFLNLHLTWHLVFAPVSKIFSEFLISFSLLIFMDYFDFGINDKCGFCVSARVLSLSVHISLLFLSLFLGYFGFGRNDCFFTFLMNRKPIEHFLKAVEEVTLKDIATISEKLISSPLTMASWGDGIFLTSFMVSHLLYSFILSFFFLFFTSSDSCSKLRSRQPKIPLEVNQS